MVKLVSLCSFTAKNCLREIDTTFGDIVGEWSNKEIFPQRMIKIGSILCWCTRSRHLILVSILSPSVSTFSIWQSHLVTNSPSLKCQLHSTTCLSFSWWWQEISNINKGCIIQVSVVSINYLWIFCFIL